MAKKNKALHPRTLYDFAARFGLITFTVIVLCSLIFVVISLNDIVQIPYTGTNASSANTTSNDITIDQAVIDKLNTLKSSDSNTDQPLPSGRISPFAE